MKNKKKIVYDDEHSRFDDVIFKIKLVGNYEEFGFKLLIIIVSFCIFIMSIFTFIHSMESIKLNH